jgi:hypothetical protein
MAVQFQRRNVGALMELPTFDDVGVSAYQDFTQGGQPPALMEEPMQEILPPQSESQVAAAEDAAAQLIAAAEKQRAAAGNPLNRGLSILGGVIGAPFNFLGAALGGGDMSAVTAPFRPQQQADMRFQQTRMGIEDKLAEIRKDYAGMENSRAGALRQALGANREQEAAGYDTLGQLTSSMLFMDSAARAQRVPALMTLARRFPQIAGDVKDLIDGGFDDASLATYASLSGDEGARQRGNEFLYGNKTINFGEGVGAILPSRPGVAPQVVGPGMTISAPPAIGGRPTVLNTPAPAVGEDGFPTSLTEEQYRALVGATSQQEVDQLIRSRGITVGTPAPPAGDTPPPPPGFVLEN